MADLGVTAIHPTAIVDDGVSIGEGTKVWQWVHICKGARIGLSCMLGQGVYVGPSVVIGDGCHIQNGGSIFEGVTLESQVFVGPNATFTNVKHPNTLARVTYAYEKTLVKGKAMIGANATIICGVIIGKRAVVGAGAVVTHDVPDGMTVVGNPARELKR